MFAESSIEGDSSEYHKECRTRVVCTCEKEELACQIVISFVLQKSGVGSQAGGREEAQGGHLRSQDWVA